jgi:hypothetical protein
MPAIPPVPDRQGDGLFFGGKEGGGPDHGKTGGRINSGLLSTSGYNDASFPVEKEILIINCNSDDYPEKMQQGTTIAEIKLFHSQEYRKNNS